jgi:uncharacterized protein YjbI with pentapeptide repeats
MSNFKVPGFLKSLFVKTGVLTLVKTEPLDFSGQDLRSVDLSQYRGRLAGANFNGANLSGKDLRGLDFTGAKFRGADLDGVTADHTTVFRKADFSSLSYFDLERMGRADGSYDRRAARLTNGHFNGADFDGGFMIDAVLDQSDFSGAKLTSIHVGSASFKGTICHGTDFTGAYTCLFNGLGEVGPRLRATSPELAGAFVSADTVFDPKPYSRKVEPDESGRVTANIGPATITFGNGPTVF